MNATLVGILLFMMSMLSFFVVGMISSTLLKDYYKMSAMNRIAGGFLIVLNLAGGLTMLTLSMVRFV